MRINFVSETYRKAFPFLRERFDMLGQYLGETDSEDILDDVEDELKDMLQDLLDNKLPFGSSRYSVVHTDHLSERLERKLRRYKNLKEHLSYGMSVFAICAVMAMCYGMGIVAMILAHRNKKDVDNKSAQALLGFSGLLASVSVMAAGLIFKRSKHKQDAAEKAAKTKEQADEEDEGSNQEGKGESGGKQGEGGSDKDGNEKGDKDQSRGQGQETEGGEETSDGGGEGDGDEGNGGARARGTHNTGEMLNASEV
ncbi:hypothetical protein PTSG_02089 [Salpingoeca rosetta]|uniref:Uncharacterized protein n=1 Tax=Salpingoeca rosetta (strain ATCC 50818 / BSB-021) TaxID=946362 RepID=F2U2L5_SALR5|nr:uncharacterized protein PTSG_02089 [Salpingoeca rosetta]EGD81370.1 hypothetical protein PTSG_02089 [Salpingoeca rosetta]|eukprot:XP_004996574.1 hypothetical protein PTSG_02089 [Salpingoeca rosetta]